jgi:hypothetical protein
MRALKGWKAWVLAVYLLAPVYAFSQEETVFDFEQYADTAAFVAATNIGHQGGITDRALETTNLAAPGSTAAAKGIVAANTQGWGQFWFGIPQMSFSPYDVLEFWGKIEGGCATGWSVKIGGGQDNSSKSVYFTDRWERYRIPFGSFTTIGKSDWDSGNPAPFNNITHMEIQLQGFVNNTDGNVFLDAVKVVSVADLADQMLLDFETYNQSQIDEILLYGGVSVVSLETANLPPDGGTQALKVDYDNTGAQSAIEITLPSPTNMMDLPYVTFWAKSSIKTASLQVGLIDVDLVNGDGRDLSPAQKLTDGWVQYSIPLCDFLDGKGDYWQRGVNWANVGKIQFLPVGGAGTLTVDNVRLTRYPVAPLPMLEDFEAYDAAALDKVKLSAGATSKTLERSDIVWGADGGTKAFRMAFDNSTQGYSMAEFSLPSAVDMTNCDKITFWAKGTTDNAGLTIAVADKARAGCNVFEGLKVTKQWLKYAIPKSKFVKSPYWNQAVDWSTVDLIQIQPTGDAGELAIDSIAMTVVSTFTDFMIEDFERFAPDAAITYQAGVTTASIETMILPPGTTSTQSLVMLWNDPEPRQWWGQAVFSSAAAVDVSQAYAIRFWGKGTAEGQTISIKAFDSAWAGSSRVADIALTTEWKQYEVLMTQFIAEDPLKPCDWTKAQNFQLQAGGTFGLMYFDEFWAVGPPTATVLSARTPAADAEVETLNSVTVTFSEPMDGVVATMLSVNGSSATLATTTDNISFTFTGFAAPAAGSVTIVLSPSGTYKGDTWVCSLVQKVEAVAEPVTTAPTLDGVLNPGEWVGAAYVPLQTVPGDAAPADAADLSAKFYVMHDAQYIYVAVDVTDSVMASDPATTNSWENDTVEVFFDMDHDHTGYGQPGGQFGLTWDGTILGGNLTADFEGKGGADSWSAAAATHEGGYAIEFRLLRSAFSPAEAPDGSTVGFNVQVQDNDGSGRESRLWWSSTAGDTDPWDNAAAWGHLLLKGGGPVPLTVNVLPNTGAGTVTADPTSGDGTYEFGTTVTLTAVPAAGYRFVNWTGDVTGTEASILVTMSGVRTVTANFEPIPTHTVTVTATPSEGGTVSRTPSKDVYAEGEKVTLTATPATNWVFRGWLDGATTVSTDVAFEYTVGTANMALTAKFKAVAPPAVATIENLSVSPGDIAAVASDPVQKDIFNVVSPGIDTVGVNKLVYLKAVPKEGSEEAISGYTWAVKTEPSAGAAVIDATVGDLGSILKWHATVEGQYVLTLTPKDLASNPTTTTQIAITAAKFMGMTGGAPTCVACHETEEHPEFGEAVFGQTGHANKLKKFLNGEQIGYYQTSCLNCHAVGAWAGSASTGDNNFFEVAARVGFDVEQIPALVADAFTNKKQNWDVLPVELQKMGNIQCESCHGPGNQHKGDPAKISGGDFSAKVCAYCHDAPTYYMQTYEWKQSGHDAFLEEEAGRTTCQPCHTAQGFVEMKLKGAAATSSAPDSGITCVACHDPHSDANPGQLRSVAAVTLPNKQVYDAGTGNLCANCHNSRIADPNVTNDPAKGSYRGAHYGPMADVLLGSSAYDWGIPFTLGAGTHYRAVDDSCVTCHQGSPTQEGVTNPVPIGGHTFQINLKLKDGSTTSTVATSCATAECHPGLTTTDRIPSSAHDYDGNGAVEGVQTEVTGLLAILKTELMKLVGTSLDEESGIISIGSDPWKALTQDQRGALYNYNLIVKDGSKGVHNTKFSVGVVQRSYGKLTGTPYKTAYPDAWIVEDNYFSVTVAADPANGGTVAKSPDRSSYLVGRTVTLTATPADGWIFKAWMDGATTVSTTASYSYTVENANKTFTAKFEQLPEGQYTVTVVADPANAGTVTKTPEAVSYSVGTQLTLNATAAEGWAFVAWMDGATTLSTSASFPYTVTATYKTFTAKFQVYTGPARPTGVTAVGNTFRVLVSWPAVPGAASYVVTRTQDGAAPVSWPTPATEFADDSAKPGVSYAYTVKAVDAQQQESAPSAVATAAVTAETITAANYKVTAKGYTMTRDASNNLTFAGATAGTIKIAVLKKLPSNTADVPAKGIYYLQNLGQVPTLTITGDVKTLAFDVPVYSLAISGAAKSVSAKSVTFLSAREFGTVSIAATKDSGAGLYARTFIETAGTGMTPMSIKATGAVIEEVGSTGATAQPVKLLNVASKVYKDVNKVSKTSLGAIGSLPKVVADLTNAAAPASEATPSSIQGSVLKAVTVSGGSIVADELVGAIDKVTVSGGNLRPALIQSSKNITLIQATAKKGVGGAIGTVGAPTALAIKAQPPTVGKSKTALTKVYGQTVLSGYFYAGYDAATGAATHTGGIGTLQTKTGTVQGAAFLDPALIAKMKVLPKGQTIPTNPDLQ